MNLSIAAFKFSRLFSKKQQLCYFEILWDWSYSSTLWIHYLLYSILFFVFTNKGDLFGSIMLNHFCTVESIVSSGSKIQKYIYFASFYYPLIWYVQFLPSYIVTYTDAFHKNQDQSYMSSSNRNRRSSYFLAKDSNL